MQKLEIGAVVFIITLFLSGSFSSLSYGSKLKYDCSIKAMESKYTSAEIQTICKF